MGAFDDRLRIVTEFRTDEHDHVRSILFGRLEKRLLHWRPDQVELELSVKERGTRQQHTVLECWIAGLPHLAAKSDELELDTALADVRDDLHRQLDRIVDKREDSRRA